jgi:hypothetical protein
VNNRETRPASLLSPLVPPNERYQEDSPLKAGSGEYRSRGDQL